MNVDGIVPIVSWTLLHFLWQGMIVGIIAFGLCNVCRAKYSIATAAMLALAVLAIGTTAIQWQRHQSSGLMVDAASNVAVHDTTPTRATDPSNHKLNMEAFHSQATDKPRYEPGDDSSAVTPATDTIATEEASPVESVSSRFSWGTFCNEVVRCHHWIATFWMCGVLVCSFRLILHWQAMRVVRRSGVELVPTSPWIVRFDALARRVGIKPGVRLLSSTTIAVPVTMGFLKPVVIVPLAMLSNMPVTQIEALLLHELAHVRRHDYLVNLLQTVMETLFFFHPVVWWLSRTMREEREHCCDRIASDVCGDAQQYAWALTELESLRSQDASLVVAADGGSHRKLLGRIERLLCHEPSRPSGNWLLSLVIVVAGFMAIGAFVIATNAVAQPNPPQTSDEQPMDTENKLQILRSIQKQVPGMFGDSADVAQMLEQQQTDVSPDGRFVALKRANTVFVIEPSYMQTMTLGVAADVKGISFRGQSLMLHDADGTEQKLDFVQDRIQLKNSLGRVDKVDEPVTFAEAFKSDPTYSDEPLSQIDSINLWRGALRNDKLTPGERAFAWWRIGSQAATNFDTDAGEQPQYDLAEMAFGRIRELAEDWISLETLNAATAYGGLPGTPDRRAARMAESYIWLMTRTDEMVRQSATRINHNGYLIDGDWTLGGMRLESPDQKVVFLRKSLRGHQDRIRDRITQEIQYTQTPVFIEQMLKTIDDKTAQPEQLRDWQASLELVRTQIERDNAHLARQNDQAQATTRQLYEQYVNRVGKIESKTIDAAIELVAAQGRQDHELRAKVLADFQKRASAEKHHQVIRNLLELMTKWLTIEGGWRWLHENPPVHPQQQAVPTDPKTLYAQSPMLSAIIKHGYQAGAFDVQRYALAVRQAYHPEGKQFLLDILAAAAKPQSPFDAAAAAADDDAEVRGNWDGRTPNEESQFIAAVGLAELGQAAGIEWLIAKAQPNDFGDGSLDFVRHANMRNRMTLRVGDQTFHSSSLRANCTHVLAELSGLEPDINPAQWKAWWQENEQKFHPQQISIEFH